MVDETFSSGRYRTASVLARGTYATVLEAHDTKTGDRVALKVLALGGDHPEIAEAMFRKEVDALEGFEHRAVVRMRDRFIERDRQCAGIVLDLVPGGMTLEAYMQSAPRPTLPWRLEQLAALLDGLDVAHRRDVIHRDVKLTNILVDRDDDALRLVDFGIARILAAYARPDPGVTLRHFYSRPFAAPEQVLEGDATSASDLHAFALVIASVLAWCPPPADFRRGDMAAFVAATRDEIRDPALAGDLLRLLEGLTDPVPCQRPRAYEVARLLQSLAERTAERVPLPIRLTTSARTRARESGCPSDAALLADLNESLRVRYEPGKDRRTGAESFTVRCFGTRLWVLARPDDEEPERLIVVDAGHSAPTIHARDREKATPALFQLALGHGSALALIDLAYTTHAAEQLRLEERRKKDSLLEVSKFVLGRQRERMAHLRIRYRQLAPPSRGWRGSPAEPRQGPDGNPPADGADLTGDYLALEVLGVSPWDDDASEADVLLATWADDLDGKAQFARQGQRVGSFHSYDRETRKLTLRRASRHPVPREGDLEYKDIAMDTALRRQASALEHFYADACVNPRLGRLLLHPEENDLSDVVPVELMQPLEPRAEVQELVEHALGARDFFLIQGPPGTGKTTLIAEIMAQILTAAPGSRICLTSQSNEAVNNALSELQRLAERAGQNWLTLRDVRDERAHSEGQGGFEETFGRWATRVRERSSEALSAAVVSLPPDRAEAVRSAVVAWQECLGRAEDVRQDYAEQVQVYGVTCLRVPTLYRRLREVSFDWVIVDEAARATPSEVLVSLVVGRRFVLVGDHRQLPPFLDLETKRDLAAAGVTAERAQRSLFEEIFGQISPSNRRALRRQFRMHRSIGDFVGRMFYDDIGGLETGVADADRTIALARFDRSHRVFWVDVKGREVADGTSWSNPEEAALVMRLLREMETELRAKGVRYTVGVIAAYAAQAERLRKKIVPKAKSWAALQIRVDTVDAFQGKQDDVIVYSIARTGEDEMRFVSDRQRLNVAFSRAKRLLVIVGRRASAQRSPRLATALKLIPAENLIEAEAIQ